VCDLVLYVTRYGNTVMLRGKGCNQIASISKITLN